MCVTPASNGPRTRTSEQVPAVQSTTSAQKSCAVHGVWLMLLVSEHAVSRRTLHETGSAADSRTRPQVTRSLPHVLPFSSFLAVRSHCARNVAPLTAWLIAFLPHSRKAPRLAKLSHGQRVSSVARKVAMPR